MNYQKSNTYHNPVEVLKKERWNDEVVRILRNTKKKNPLIVTSAGTISRINLKKYIEYNHIISDVPPNPTIHYCDEKLNQIRNQGIDSIIAIGGGSVMDAAKVFFAGISIKKKEYNRFD